jgi:hypothetical protein
MTASKAFRSAITLGHSLFFLVLVFKHRVLCSLGKCPLYHFSHANQPFYYYFLLWFIFQIISSSFLFFALDGLEPQSTRVFLLHSWDCRCVTPCSP